MTVMESYIELPPLPSLAGAVRTVWIQRTGKTAYVQRHLPTGGVEIHFPIGGPPQLVGPLTGPEIEVIPAHTTIVGVRFQPGTPPPLRTGLDDLVDQRLSALAQAGATATGQLGADGIAGLAIDAGYADQAHLSRECLRLTGLTPRRLLGGSIDRCACGHDHSASYKPFLATRSRPPIRV
jgi:hypothetical protein